MQRGFISEVISIKPFQSSKQICTCAKRVCLSSFVCVCVYMQDGVKSLEEAMSYNTSITELDIRLTEASEQSASIIMQAVLANQQGLEQKKSAQPGEIK